jgi:3'-phosphoadenosine 5'-phosphosulfate sulfotransferase (PAPS reductase)/FAD synthetase
MFFPISNWTELDVWVISNKNKSRFHQFTFHTNVKYSWETEWFGHILLMYTKKKKTKIEERIVVLNSRIWVVQQQLILMQQQSQSSRGNKSFYIWKRCSNWRQTFRGSNGEKKQQGYF